MAYFPIPCRRLASEVITGSPAQTTLKDSERTLILRTLEAADWLIGGPRAQPPSSGLKRTTLISKMKKLGISRPAANLTGMVLMRNPTSRSPSPQSSSPIRQLRSCLPDFPPPYTLMSLSRLLSVSSMSSRMMILFWPPNNLAIVLVPRSIVDSMSAVGQLMWRTSERLEAAAFSFNQLRQLRLRTNLAIQML